MKGFILVISIFVLVFILKIVFEYLENKKSSNVPKKRFPYVQKRIMTNSEEKVFRKLEEIVGDKYYIFPQIHLASLLDVKKEENQRKKFFNKIIQKSVDFVLVDKQNFSTKLVVEFDDRSHYKENRKKRDNFVNQSFDSAGVDILHLWTMDRTRIGELLKSHLDK